MGTIYTALQFWEEMRDGGIVREVAEAMVFQKEEIHNVLSDQLLEGRDSKGELITPSYFTDSYFKTPEAAQRYSDWKDRISPPTSRPSGTPNLFINGRYHSSLNLVVTGDVYTFLSNDPNAPEIQTRFADAIGLSPESRQKVWEELVREIVIGSIQQKQLS